MAKKHSSGTGMGVLAVFGVVALVAGLAVFVAVRAKNKPQTYIVKGALTTGHTLPTSNPVAKHVLDFTWSGDPLLADVDADFDGNNRVDEIIVWEERGYAAINTRTDQVVWRTPPIDPPSPADPGWFAWVAGDSFVVSRGVDVSVYSLKKGALVTTFRLASPVVRPCASASPVLARVSLASGDLDLMRDNRRTRATGECLPVETDGFVADRAAMNGRALACDDARLDCRKSVPAAALPSGFVPLEAQWTDRGATVTLFGTIGANSVIAGVGKRAWSSPLVPLRAPDGFRPNGGDVANDPAFIGWQASDGGRVLVFRSYVSGNSRKTFRTLVEGLDGETGKRDFVSTVNGAVVGVRYKDPSWFVMTPTSVSEISAGGTVRTLIGPD